MELTPEERQRIYEEERVQREACQELQPPKRGATGKVILGIIVFLVITVLTGCSSEEHHTTSNSSPSSSKSGVRTVRGTYWCAENFDDAGQIGIAVTRGDTAAIAGMLARGKAFQVEEGTLVVTGGEIDMGISRVHIESGFQAGRDCYISTNALK
jgi:hypothetical protein